MTCIVLKHSYVLYAFIVFALHIYVTLSYNVDYEYPYKITDDYDAYFIHESLRFNTRKLNVDDYYLSVYNAFERRLPLLTETTYDIYTKRYYETRSDTNEIQKNVYKNTSIIEEKYLDRKIYDKNKSYHTTRADFYEMNKNFIRVVAIIKMIKMMSLSDSSGTQFDVSIINLINKQAQPPSPSTNRFSTVTCHPVFKSFGFGRQKSTVEEKRLPLDSFRQNFKQSNYSADTTVEVLSEEQYLKIRELMTLLPTKEDNITSYYGKFTSLLRFMDKNFKNTTQRPIKFDKLSQERIEALRSKHPLKNETYNFYLVRSKVYGFLPFHFKFCQDHFNVFKNEKEADLSSLFGIPKSEPKPTY